MRGLKLLNRRNIHKYKSRIFYRCVDWNTSKTVPKAIIHCRIFYRCVDWNPRYNTNYTSHPTSRIFYRCVDWNPILTKEKGYTVGRIFYRCVDWNLNCTINLPKRIKSHLLQMRGLKPCQNKNKNQLTTVASFTDAWIETGWPLLQFLPLKVASFTDAWIETTWS